MGKTRDTGSGAGLAVCVLIGVGLGAAGLTAGPHATGVLGGLTRVNDALRTLSAGASDDPQAPSSYNPVSWAKAVLHRDGDPVNSCTVGAITGWEGAEGDWAAGNKSWHNPLNTTLRRHGSHAVNIVEPGVGVQAYPTWTQGLSATAATLHEPRYASVRAALAASNPQAVADAVAASPWGTGPFTARCR
jgi:hypothetical protein